MQLWKLRSLTICWLKAGEPERLRVWFSMSPKVQSRCELQNLKPWVPSTPVLKIRRWVSSLRKKQFTLALLSCSWQVKWGPLAVVQANICSAYFSSTSIFRKSLYRHTTEWSCTSYLGALYPSNSHPVGHDHFEGCISDSLYIRCLY